MGFSAFTVSYFNSPQRHSSAYTADDFVTTWEIKSSYPQVQIPVYKTSILTGYNYTIDWGDGSPIQTSTDNTVPIHRYSSSWYSNNYQIVIPGNFSGWTFNQDDTEAVLNNNSPYGNDRMSYKLKKINQWGTNQWKRMDYMFADCQNLRGEYSGQPNIGQVTNMPNMFLNARFFNSRVDGLNTGAVTDMYRMFMGAEYFNQSVSFDTAIVQDFSGIFNKAKNFNQQVNFNTVSAVNMAGMFNNTVAFSQSLANFDFSHIDFFEKFIPLDGFLDDSGLYAYNYDATLTKISQQVLHVTGVMHSQTLGANNLKYCAAETAKQQIINKNIAILGDSKDCSGYHLTDLTLETTSFSENNQPNFAFSKINVTTTDTTNSHTVSTSCSASYPDNANFTTQLDSVLGYYKLIFILVAYYEIKNIHNICLKATNSTESIERTFTINILDVFEPVISLQLSTNNINFDFAVNELGNTKTNTVITNTSTNNPSGYQLSLYARNSTALTNLDTSIHTSIPTTTTSTSVSSMPSNTWSFSLDNLNISPIPSTPIIIYTHHTNNSVNTYYHVKPGTSLITGQYQTTLVYSVVVSP